MQVLPTILYVLIDLQTERVFSLVPDSNWFVTGKLGLVELGVLKVQWQAPPIFVEIKKNVAVIRPNISRFQD